MTDLHQPIQKVNVFIGYDERQDLAYRTCKESIEQLSTDIDISIQPIKHRELRELKFLSREWKITANGDTIDCIDNRPFSTNFAFTRFLVPHYAKYLGMRVADPCVFVDSDFVFLRSLRELFDEIDFYSKPLWVVKHDYHPAHVIKMDNQSQSKYNKKLWSSFMVFNLNYTNCAPAVVDINNQDGMWLHQFKWLHPDDVGSIYEGWNFIPDHSELDVPLNKIKAIHYTEGVPLMKPGCKYSDVFNNHLSNFLRRAARDPIKEFA